MMNKEILPKEVAEAIEKLRADGMNNYAIMVCAQHANYDESLLVIQDWAFECEAYSGKTDKLMNALVNGYEVEKTPEEVFEWEDATFIACAREDIPKLLAEIERLNKIIEECAEDLGAIEGNILGTIGSFTHVSVRLSDIMDVKDKLEEAMSNERK